MRLVSDIIIRYFRDLIQHRRVFWMQCIIFLIISSLLTLKPMATGLLLSYYNIGILPVAFLTTAASALALTWLYNLSVKRYHVIDLLRIILQISGIILVSSYVLLLVLDIEKVLVFVLYVFVSLFGLMTASQFWLIANQLFNNREAKKYFGRLGTGAIAGGIFGGYMASIVSQLVNVESLLIIATVLLLPIFPLLSRIKKISESLIPETNYEASEPVIGKSWELIWNSRHLRYLSLIVGVSVLAARLIDYEFNYFAEQRFVNEEDLTSFFGFWYSTINLCAFSVQLGLTSRIVGRLGIGYSIFILPVILLLNSVLLLVLPVLGVAVALKLMDGTLKQSIHKASVELIILPIPYDVKIRTKSFIDVFIDSLATGISGILIIVLASMLLFPNLAIILLLVGSIIGWVLLSGYIRKEYKKTFRLFLKQHFINSRDDFHDTIIDRYSAILKTGNEFQVLKVLRSLHKEQVEPLREPILELCLSARPAISALAIEKLGYLHEDYSDLILPLIKSANNQVKVTAYQYLLTHEPRLEFQFFQNKLDAEDINDRIAALLALVKEYPAGVKIRDDKKVDSRVVQILSEIQGMEDSKSKDLAITGIMRVIGFGNLKQHFEYLIANSRSSNNYIAAQSLMSMGHSRSRSFIPYLLQGLNRPDDIKLSAIKGLSGFSSEILAELSFDLLKQREFEKLEWIPEALQLKPDSKSVEVLIKLARLNHIAISSKSIIAFCHLLHDYPLLPVKNEALKQLLLDHCHLFGSLSQMIQAGRSGFVNDAKYQAVLDLILQKEDLVLRAIFQLLHIKYPPENVMEIYEMVTGSDESVRQNAIEYLNDLLADPLKQMLIPAIERSLLPASFTVNKNLFKHLSDTDEIIRQIKSLNDPDLNKLINEFSYLD